MIANITLNGVRDIDLNFVVLRGSQRPVLPPTVDRFNAIAGKSGIYDFGADLGAKQFDFACAFNAANPAQLAQYASALAVFLLDERGKPRDLELVILTQPDRKYTVRLSGATPFDRYVGEFKLPLIAVDPFAYGSTEITELVLTTSPQAISIISDGNVFTEPVIELTNVGATTITNLVLRNEYQLE